jgi:hypothetical protein
MHGFGRVRVLIPGDVRKGELMSECSGRQIWYGDEYGYIFEHPYPMETEECPKCGPVIREADYG